MLFLLDDAPAPITWADFLHLEYEAPTPVEATVVADTLRAVAELLGLLAPAERTVVEQTMFEGRTLAAAASDLGLCMQRAQQLRASGLMRLRRSPTARRILRELV